MKRTSLFLRLGLALLFCLGTIANVSPASAAAKGNRCKDRCNDAYHRRMEDCRGLRKYDKRRCEDRAKREHNECRHRCR
jgi:hypothetical protein